MRSPRAFIRDLTENRESESARLFLMSTYLLLIIACYTTTKAVRDSLFIIKVGPSQLPYLYLLIAASMGLISAAYPRALRRISLYGLVRVTSLIAIGSFIFFWWLVHYEGRSFFYILYVWVSLFGAISASQAWSVANQVFNAREARRTFAWIGLGGVVGGIVGGSLARIVAPWKGTELLLPICAVLMVLTLVILHRLARNANWTVRPELVAEGERPEGSASAVFAQVKASSYLSWIVAFLFAGVIIEAFIDYEFKVIAHQSFESKDKLTAFFGTIASYGGMLALLVQTLFTSRFLKRFGVGPAILLLPSALLAGFLVVAARPALWSASLLKLIDGGLSYSVHRSGMELLYVPIAARLRASVKAFIDLLVDRAGRAVGGILLLLLTAGLSLSIPLLSLTAAIFLAACLGIALAIRRDYVKAFRVVLERRVIEPEALDIRTLDHTSINALLQALSSADDRQVLYALDLLGSSHHSRWHRHLPALVAHQSPAVRKRTIELLTQWNVYSPALIADRLSDSDLKVRIEAVRHLAALDPGSTNERLQQFLGHDDYGVVLAAMHCIAKYRLGNGALIDEPLIARSVMTNGDHGIDARTAAARALAAAEFQGSTRFLDLLLQDSSVDVLRQAVRTTGEVRHAGAIPLLIALLARSSVRGDAREALIKIGEPAMPELRSQLQNDLTPIEVRSRIPKVLSLFNSQDIADFLMTCVHRSGPRLDRPLLKALNRMRSLHPDVAFHPESVSILIGEEHAEHFRLSRIRDAIQVDNNEKLGDKAAPLLSLMTRTLDERLAESVERVLRLLALIYAQKDIHAVFFNVTSGHELKASAVEFLDNLIDPKLRPLVMPLLENDVKPGSTDNTESVAMGRDEAIQILMTDEDDWIKTLARDLSERLRNQSTLTPKTA